MPEPLAPFEFVCAALAVTAVVVIVLFGGIVVALSI